MKTHRSQCLAIAVSIATAAFAPAEDKPAAAKAPAGSAAGVAATVNGDAITTAEIEQVFERWAAEAVRRGTPMEAVAAQKAGVLKEILDDTINNRLVMKAAASVKVEPTAVDAEFEKILAAQEAQTGKKPTMEEVKTDLAKNGMTLESLKETIAKRMQQREWMEAQLKGKAADATEPEVKEFYEKNPQFFTQPEQVRASHILFLLKPDAAPEAVAATFKKAEVAVTRAKKEDFAKLAGELSEEPGAKERGGDLNYFPRKGAMVEPFAEAAFKLKKDEVSAEPVRSEFGYHIIKVTDRKDASKVPFDEVKPKIVAHLSNDRKKAAVDGIIAAMRAKADVKLNVAAPAAPAPAPAPAPGK